MAHNTKKCGLLYQLLVPLSKASRIARHSRKSNAGAHACMYIYNCIYLTRYYATEILHTHEHLQLLCFLNDFFVFARQLESQRTKHLYRHFLIKCSPTIQCSCISL